MSIGLALIFGVMRVVSFAQGDFMMLGMYLTYFYAMSGIDPLLGAILTIPPFFVLGWLVHRGLLARVTGGGDPQRQMDAQLILTLGLSLVITNATTMILTPTPRGIRTVYATRPSRSARCCSTRRAPTRSRWRWCWRRPSTCSSPAPTPAARCGRRPTIRRRPVTRAST